MSDTVDGEIKVDTMKDITQETIPENTPNKGYFILFPTPDICNTAQGLSLAVYGRHCLLDSLPSQSNSLVELFFG